MQNLEALLTDEEYNHFYGFKKDEYMIPLTDSGELVFYHGWIFELAKLFFWGFGFGVGFMGVLIGVSYL